MSLLSVLISDVFSGFLSDAVVYVVPGMPNQRYPRLLTSRPPKPSRPTQQQLKRKVGFSPNETVLSGDAVYVSLCHLGTRADIKATSFVTFKSVENYKECTFARRSDGEEQDAGDCSICLEGFENSSDVVVPCLASMCHLFHRSCVQTWLTKKVALHQGEEEESFIYCPVCNRPWLFSKK